MLMMYQIGGVEVPLGYHLQFFLEYNYGDDDENPTEPIIMMS